MAADKLDAGRHAAAQPPNLELTLQLARAARSAGDLSAAIAFYRQVAAAPGSGAALKVELGDTLLLAGMIDDAIGAYQSVPPNDKAEVDALLGLRNAYARLGQSQSALEFAQRAVNLAPDSEPAQVSLGISLDLMSRHTEAQGAYRTALKLAPRSVAARSDLALSLAFSGQFPEAISLLRPIASSTNASVQARQNMAVIYGQEGDRAQALAWSLTDLPATQAEANEAFVDSARLRLESTPGAAATPRKIDEVLSGSVRAEIGPAAASVSTTSSVRR